MNLGMFAGLAGGILGGAAAAHEKGAMADEFKRELKRQQIYQRKAREQLYPSVEKHGVETFRENQAASEADRLGGYENIYKVPLAVGGTGATARDKAYYDAAGRRRAKVASYGEAESTRDYDTNRVNQEIARILDFAKGTSSVFPYKMYDAQHSWDELAAWGQIIGSLGGAAANYAQLGGGGGAPGTAATPATGGAPYSPQYQAALDQQLQQKMYDYAYGTNFPGNYQGGF